MPKMHRGRTAVAAALLLGVTAGCGGGQTGQALKVEQNGSKVYRAGTPTKPLDQVKWYTFYRPVLGLVSAAFNDYPELMVNANLCESVVRLDPDYSIKPGLTTFTVNPDSTVFTYKIRPGAKFWDGSPVTTGDIIYSITANTTGSTGAQNATIGNEIKSMVATAPDTVTITLKAPDIIFNDQLAGSAGKVYQKKQAQAAGQNWGLPAAGVMCTGPYKTGRWDPASSLEIVRNDDYWGPDFKPLVRSVVFSWPQDPTTLANAFRGGTLDGGWNIPPSIVPTLQRSGNGTMIVGSSDNAVQMYGLVVSNTTKGSLADPKVRQALSKSIDRDAIAAKIYNGAADPLAGLIPPGSIGDDSTSLKSATARISTAQDVVGAKQLIAETGKPAPTLTLALPAADALANPTAVAVQSQAAAAGFKITLKPMEPNQYAQLFADPAARKGVDLFFTVYAPIVHDPIVYLNDLIAADGVYNFNGYDNPMVQRALADARAQTDPAKRADGLLRAQDQFLKDLPLLPLTAPRVTVWEGPGLTGSPTTFTYVQSPWAALLGGK
ncbi:ABC transporter substrate-binding protein [Nonomuraea sp. NPDC046802]|uniref:ABC transporter substrate-binding protein n=1 Tax=Nonomuraea sp. NPDC046802 TaxID=3154919 RepID=UPI0033F0E9DA